jgi:hypothetical protein
MSNLNLSIAAANGQATALAALASGGMLVLYSGAQPATPETSIGASAALATFALGAPAFAAPVAGQITLNPPTPATVGSSGTAAWFRVYAADGVTPIFDGNVGTITGSAWAQSTSYSINQIVSANGNAYLCSAAGTTSGSGSGPATTGQAIADGGVVWQYLSIAGGDINFNTVGFNAGNTVALSSYTLQIPGV